MAAFSNKKIKSIWYLTRSQKMTFGEFFYDKYYPFSQSTKRRSKLDWYIYKKHFEIPFGKKILSEICGENIDVWMTEQIGAQYKPSTVNKHVGLLNRIFNVALEWEYIKTNPVSKAIIKKLPTGDHVQRFLAPTEIRDLLDACNRSSHPYLYHFIKLLLLTGARSSEMRLCKWRDLDMVSSELFIGLSKNGRSRRIILSEAALNEFSVIKLKSNDLGLPINGDNWVFINPKTNRPYTSMHLAFNRARATIGFYSVRIHDLRHTYASLLINNGASIYEVKQLLGHHHISMTERYAHLFPNTLKERSEIVATSLFTTSDFKKSEHPLSVTQHDPSHHSKSPIP